MPPNKPMDLLCLGADLQTVFPALGPVTPCRILGAGFRSLAVETAEGWVFRIRKHPQAEAGYAKEARLLPALGPHLPVAVPAPRWVAGPSARFPGGVLGYPLLPGTPLQPAHLTPASGPRLATEIAGFLRALHRFPVAEALGLPSPDSEMAGWAAMQATVLPALRGLLAAAEYQTVARWWAAFLADPALRAYPPALVHGDLWYENILVDDAGQRIVGVVDFEDAAVGDPAQDFATLRHLGAPFADAVLAAYRAAGGTLDPGFAHRLQRRWELREFDGLQFALQIEDAAETADAIRKLRAGPILNPGAD
jgi:aminoglycoside 2''-phosphotransferase